MMPAAIKRLHSAEIRLNGAIDFISVMDTEMRCLIYSACMQYPSVIDLMVLILTCC
jgi:hypothetical protein